MGPLAGGLGLERVPATLPRWRERLERTWGVTLHPPRSAVDVELARCVDQWERGLREIELPGVTDEDRVTYLEHVVSWNIRRALRAGRFDLALAIRALGARRVADLVERRQGWRPVLIHGVSGHEGRPGLERLRASRASRT